MATLAPRRIWFALALTALVAAGLTWWLTMHFSARIPLRDQSLRASLPADLPVRVEVLQARGPSTRSGRTDADDAQGIPVRLNEQLELQADFDTTVPLALTVRYRGEIPVKTLVPVDTTMKTRVLGVPMTIPVQGSIPLDFKLPVDLQIPIRQPVRLKFTAPVSARIDQVVHIPLRAELDTRIHFVDPVIPILVREADLEVPLEDVSLVLTASPP